MLGSLSRIAGRVADQAQRPWSAAVLNPMALAVVLMALVAAAPGAEGAAKPSVPASGVDLESVLQRVRVAGQHALAWYQRTPPADRVTWGGLAAAGLLGAWVVLERTLRLRRKWIIPEEFVRRFQSRLEDGKLDRGKALDFCELNPSPAARVALAAVRRWGRPPADLERAVGLAHRIEADALRRNVGTLRRIAALTPLIGLLGTLFMTSRALASVGPDAAPTSWAPSLADALGPLTAGVALAIVALVVYDGLSGRIEKLVGALDRVGAETIDAVTMALPPEPRAAVVHPAAKAVPPPAKSARTPHQIRLEVPKPDPRAPIDLEDEDYD